MKRAGWCINTINYHLSAGFMNYVMLSILVQLPPYIRSSTTEHEHCTPWSCVFYTFANTDEYVPRHVDPTCHCQSIHPPIEEVTQMLRDGVVPVMVYDGALLHVRPAAETSYVAISHVWADGMGSTTEGGLPTCVVRRIASLVQDLHPETGAFWMDSLCIPDDRGVRKRAIQLMERTYRDAAKVLVVDECIRAECSEKKTWEENLFRIATSGWIRRVWTLQEGILARQLYFEFQEGPVDVEEKAGIRKPGPGEGAYRPWLSNPDTSDSWVPQEVGIYIWCLSHLPFLWFRVTHDARRPSGSLKLDAHKLRLISLLSLRSTTKAEDETIAISGMLALDLGALLAITGPDAAQRRMKDFFIQLKHVPTALAVLEAGPRLELSGFSWAPRSLTMVDSDGFLTDGPHAVYQTKGSPTGICTAAGLLAKYFVAPLQEPCTLDLRLFRQSKVGSPPSLMEQLVVRDEDSDGWYIGTRVHAGVEEQASHFITFDTLLFVDRALPGHGQTARCAAVCSVARAPAGDDDDRDAHSEMSRGGPSGSGTSQLPQRFRHVASVVLMMVPRDVLDSEMADFGPYEPGGSVWEPPRRMSAPAKKMVLLV